MGILQQIRLKYYLIACCINKDKYGSRVIGWKNSIYPIKGSKNQERWRFIIMRRDLFFQLILRALNNDDFEFI